MKSSILEEQPFSQQLFLSSVSPFSAAFLSSSAFLSSLSHQLFSAAFLSSLSQQPFSTAILTYHLAVVMGWWPAINIIFERTLSQRFREKKGTLNASYTMGEDPGNTQSAFFWAFGLVAGFPYNYQSTQCRCWCG